MTIHLRVVETACLGYGHKEMIYADYNATTPIGKAALEALRRAEEYWGNPSSSHAMGREARKQLDEARHQVATAIGTEPDTIVFTSGGSEANTLALLGSYFLNPSTFRLLTSGVEHSSVRDTAQLLENLGAKVCYTPVFPNGELNFAAFERLVEEFKPTLVSLLSANNETGVRFPIRKISALLETKKIPFHTDAVQAFGKLAKEEWNTPDFISLSSHKVFGPKGIGALVVKKGRKLAATHYGGAQEIKRRGGTENTVGIVAFGAACTELPTTETLQQLETLRDTFEKKLGTHLDGISINGAEKNRVPGTSNIRFNGIPNEILLGSLDLDGICISAGSACSSGSISPSHVLLEMGLEKAIAKECVRFSFAKTTTETEIDTIIQSVVKHVTRIRSRRA